MELTRRDALAALAAAGVAGGGAVAADRAGVFDEAFGDDERVRETMVAAAAVIYPSAVDGVATFVETYVVGRAEGRPGYRRGVREAVRDLDEYARNWTDESFAALSPADRDDLLRDLGADAADPDPDGYVASRVRFYVVNELLYALYTSPTGGRLVGLENPEGYPGGTDSYQRGPGGERGTGEPESNGAGDDR